jgi:hypothetical protein
LIKAVNKIIEEAKGKENAKFYEFTVELLNSINNAGCEERRSTQIHALWNKQREISSKYDEYLL